MLLAALKQQLDHPFFCRSHKMGLSVLEVSYMILAPISTLSGLSFLSLFYLFPELREPPNSLLIWQIVAQTVFDIHWFSAFFREE
jgi:hypothetical protein